MDSDFFSYFIPTSPVGLLAWLVPLGHLALCIASNALRKRSEAVVPENTSASPTPPGIHPILLGALVHRGAPGSASRRGVIDAAVAGMVELIRTGRLQFHDASAPRTADLRPTVPEENESPIVAERDGLRGNRRHGPESKSGDRKLAYDLFGEGMALERVAQDSASMQPFEADALSFFLPQGTTVLSFAEICWHDSRMDNLDRRFKSFVRDQFPALEAAGLIRPAPLLERILRSPLPVILIFWCMFVMTGYAGAGSGVVGMLIIMISTGALLAGAPMLTEAGAHVLAGAEANVLWAVDVVRGQRDGRSALLPGQLAALLASLTAQGYAELAADVFETLERTGATSDWDTADGVAVGSDGAAGDASKRRPDDPARQVGAFFTRQSFSDGSKELRISPAELIIRIVRRAVESIES